MIAATVYHTSDPAEDALLAPKPASPSATSHLVHVQAIQEKYEVVVCDTSGRLHTNAQLMDELAKCKRAIGKRLAGAPHETLLVLDGTTGHILVTSSSVYIRLTIMVICLSRMTPHCMLFACQHHDVVEQDCIRSSGHHTPQHCICISAS